MRLRLGLFIAASVIASAAFAQMHEQTMHHPDPAHAAMMEPEHASTSDNRQLVHFPEPLRVHELRNMRDHLLTLQKIQDALAKQQYDVASEVAEQRLGMSSFELHGAHEVAKFMPQGMQLAGENMHHAASRFALAAKDAGATGDVKPALAALSELTARCVACHASYRIN